MSEPDVREDLEPATPAPGIGLEPPLVQRGSGPFRATIRRKGDASDDVVITLERLDVDVPWYEIQCVLEPDEARHAIRAIRRLAESNDEILAAVEADRARCG